MLPISHVAAGLGLSEDLLETYGHAMAKIRLETLDRFPQRHGKLVLVTAITPTTSGEGKDRKYHRTHAGKLDVDPEGRVIGMDY